LLRNLAKAEAMTRIKTLLLTAFAMSVVSAPALAANLAPADLLSGDLGSREMARPTLANANADYLADNELAPRSDGLMSSEDLKEESGAADTSIAAVDQSQTAQNAFNSVKAGGDVNFGDVTVAQGAFTGFNGIGVFNVNTGANSNLQGSIGVAIVPN
jgi:hypothetical protein